ncbi:hypothetical protein LTR95_014003 [Oleoguttula sp. CCFEE 5521]
MANDMARWAAQELRWAEDAAMWTARRAATGKASAAIQRSTARRRVPKRSERLQIAPPSPCTAAQRLLDTTELLEAILLCRTINMRESFKLQRVSKHFAGTIAGSIKLQKKMYSRPVQKGEDGYEHLNPLFEDPEQRLRYFNDTIVTSVLEQYATQAPVAEPRVSIEISLYGWDDYYHDHGTAREMLRYFARGDFVLSRSWQKTFITHGAAETILSLHGGGDLED